MKRKYYEQLNLSFISLNAFFIAFLLIFAFLFIQPSDAESLDKNVNADGVWEQIGYGRIIEIKSGNIIVYDVSKVSCSLSFTEKLEEIGQITKVNKKSLRIVDGINIYELKRLQTLPDLCINNKENQNDPLHNFDALWHSFNENYAYFETRNIDWNAYYKKYRSRLSAESTELELHKVLKEMLDSMGDGHISLETPDNLKEAYEKEKSINDIKPKKEQKTEPKPKLSNFDLRQRIRKSITDYYLEETKLYNSGVVRWGMMKNNVGYVQINWMFLLAKYDIPEGLDFREFPREYFKIAGERTNQNQDEYDGAKYIIKKVLKDFKSAKAVVIDIRFNGGGKDEAALEFLSHFNRRKRLAFTKKARLGNEFTKKNKVFLSKANNAFTGDVYLLTSPQTASAAEIMTIASLELPNVTRIGSNTEGIFSDVLEKKLPNGWEYSLSNEVYQDLKGRNYENIGVPANKKVSYVRETNEFYNQIFEQMNDGDDAIEMALKLISEK